DRRSPRARFGGSHDYEYSIWHKTDPAWPMCGLPDVLYVDHGSDFTSDQLAHTAVDLHIRLIHSTVARPQGRGKIERFFGTINTELLATLPGHITEGHPWPTPKLSLAALDSALEAFVATYNDRTHSELGTSPRSAWIADGWLPRMPESLEDLDRLLLTVAKTRVVRRDGIRFQGLRYVSPTLAGYVGRSVVIRYDPRDITEIRVFGHDEFVCKAVNQEHHDQKVSLKEIQAARNARRRALRADINERIALVAAPTETPRIVPRQVVGRISLVLNVGVVGSARPRCTSLGRFHEMASWGRSSLYSIR
ncbi:Mu transposase C-terminal domain-containing protein, partial [Brachybacterium muris]|uniref:Mu transposase C-terminal domain-containing protein n=1 Tax=Brachybacterium muris TaxID=219301 RepID=UPI0035E979EF